jgi:hypothetical protein
VVLVDCADGALLWRAGGFGVNFCGPFFLPTDWFGCGLVVKSAGAWPRSFPALGWLRWNVGCFGGDFFLVTC